MPPLPTPGDVLRVQFYSTDDASRQAGSRFFVNYTGGTPGSGTLTTLASSIASEWATNIAPIVHSNEDLVKVVITDLSSDTGAEGVWDGSHAGGLGGPELIASACVVVDHQILRRYRGGHPRTYLRAGDATKLATMNEWTTAFQTVALAAWEAWIAAVLATTVGGITLNNIVNVSWYSGNTVFMTPSGRARNIPKLRVTPLVDEVQSSTVLLKVGSQRRRLDI